MAGVRMKAAYTISPEAARRKVRNACFQKRKDTLFWKGNQVHELLGAEVYMVIKYCGQWYEYSSNPDLSFPLSRKDIHIDYPPVKATTPQTFVPTHTSRIIKQPDPVPEATSPKISSPPTTIPATVVPNTAIESVHAGDSNGDSDEERLESQHLDHHDIIHDVTDVPYDRRQLTPLSLQVGEGKTIQQPMKRGRGRPRGSGRQLQTSSSKQL
ncbi:hypothetical protein F5Y12DRAFT_719761 [Xylaria sp. FL1777]|nr:hypothetical protein F5Y12DRAFT_719761 [Xylaria sp. FL1777]